MALTSIAPVPVRVRWDRDRRLPASVEWNAVRVDVLALRGVRDERHAHRRDHGPRLTLDLATRRGRVVLSWNAGDRRWFLEALEEPQMGDAAA